MPLPRVLGFVSACVVVCVAGCTRPTPAAPVPRKESSGAVDWKKTPSLDGPSRTFRGRLPSASWIWIPGEPNPKNVFAYFRKTVRVEGAVRAAEALVSASAVGDLYVNGVLVDRVPINSDPEYQVYEEVDLAPLLRPGENVIAALVHNFGEGMHHRMNARGGFFFEGFVETAGGRVEIRSDGSWRGARAEAWDASAPHRAPGPHLVGYKEIFDARKEPIGWNRPGFDEAGFAAPVVIGVPPVAPWNGIVVARRPPLRRQEIAARAIRRQGTFVIADLGREVVGHPFVRLRAGAGRPVQIGTAERLRADGTPHTTHSLDYRDQIVTREGAQTFQPFTYRAFRYIAIEAPDDVTVEGAGVSFRAWPVEERGRFATSDPALTEFWKIGRYTAWLCMQDTYMDTPWREQTQYIAGDSRYAMRFAHAAFSPSVELLPRYNLLSGAFSQRWSSAGAIRGRYPTDWLLGPDTSTYIPDYQLEWVLMLAEYHLYYGRDDLVRQVWPALTRVLGYFDGHVSGETGLLGQVPGWTVLDHPDTYPMDVKGTSTAMNALYVGSLRAAARLARAVMGDEQQAAAWLRRADGIREAVNTRLWSAERRALVDAVGSTRVTPQTQAYALLYDLLPPERRADAVAVIRGTKGHVAEQSFSYWVLYAMFDAGETQWGLDYMRTHWGAQTRLPSWNGAWHEAWDWNVGSTSHAWTSGPTALLTEKVLGVEPTAPGFRRFRFRPRTGDLAWAEGTIATARGDLSASWRRAGDGLVLQILVPTESGADVELPFAPRSLVVDGRTVAPVRSIALAAGKHELRAGR